jgi:DNA polymerase elongation subunit (family B)
LFISCIKTDKYFLVREIDKVNSSVCKKIPYHSNLFLETNSESDYIGFKSNKYIKKFDFDNSRDYYDFKSKFKGRVYGDIDETIQYIATLNLDTSILNQFNAWGIDIEVYSEHEFPTSEKASRFPIVAISLVNFQNKKTYTWVYDINKKCTLNQDNIFIFYDEKSMMLDFIAFFKANIKHIHILTGWNSSKFDIPYLLNRINYIFLNSTEEISEQSKKLSPFNIVKSHFNVMSNQKTFSIIGLPHLDYIDLFKKFSNEGYPSYKLEEICQTELGYGKEDHSEYISFADFYNKNINKYIEYNIKDVKLLSDLDDKFKFIILGINIAYICGINFEHIFSTVKLWEGLTYNKLIKSNIVIPPRIHKPKQDYMGAWVKEPKRGLINDIVSFDLTSLYPSVIRAINISPETLCENEFDSKASIENFINGYIPKNYHNENKIVDAAGNVFSKEKFGIIPQLMKELFLMRVETRKKMKDKQNELNHYKEMLNEN